MKKVKDLLEKPQKEQDAKIAENAEFIKLLKEERQEYLDNVTHWTQHEDKAASNFESINKALTALIRDRIHGYYFRKCMERGYITPIELEILEQLYNNYVALGGNGMISKEMETLRKLPIKE